MATPDRRLSSLSVRIRPSRALGARSRGSTPVSISRAGLATSTALGLGAERARRADAEGRGSGTSGEGSLAVRAVSARVPRLIGPNGARATRVPRQRRRTGRTVPAVATVGGLSARRTTMTIILTIRAGGRVRIRGALGTRRRARNGVRVGGALMAASSAQVGSGWAPCSDATGGRSGAGGERGLAVGTVGARVPGLISPDGAGGAGVAGRRGRTRWTVGAAATAGGLGSSRAVGTVFAAGATRDGRRVGGALSAGRRSCRCGEGVGGTLRAGTVVQVRASRAAVAGV